MLPEPHPIAASKGQRIATKKKKRLTGNKPENTFEQKYRVIKINPSRRHFV
jgi:hypothetical protein